MLSARDFVEKLKADHERFETFSLPDLEALLELLEKAEEERTRECKSLIYSTWKLDPNHYDGYWMECGKIGPHTEHEHSDTGVKWNDKEFGDDIPF